MILWILDFMELFEEDVSLLLILLARFEEDVPLLLPVVFGDGGEPCIDE